MHKCKHCGKPGKNAGGNKKHENHCPQNQERVKLIRSPRAGAKKGCVPWNKGLMTGAHDNWKKKYPLEKVMVENSTYSRHALKKRLIEENIIKYKCDICGSDPIWRGEPMPLILDHINGINNDNRLENLRFVCSNCDSQLPTYKSKNKQG